MSKYIIELNEDCKIVQQMCVTEHGNAYTDGCYSCDLEELNSDYINEHYGQLQDEAYQQGYKDAERIWRAPSSDNEFYQKGLGDAWEAARRIVVDTNRGGIALGTLGEIFGAQSYTYIMTENTAQQAIYKIKAYEDGKHSDRIEVGDEVQAPCGKAIVTLIETDDLVHYLYSGGDYGCIEPQKLKKTGKHYDIASILEAMRNDR